jgi:hypothetical protein
VDILLDANGDSDLPIDTNDLALGASDTQHISDALISFPGYWKQYPTNGIGMGVFLKSQIQPQSVLNAVKAGLQKDGYVLVNPIVQGVGDNMQLILSNTGTNTYIYKP